MERTMIWFILALLTSPLWSAPVIYFLVWAVLKPLSGYWAWWDKQINKVSRKK